MRKITHLLLLRVSRAETNPWVPKRDYQTKCDVGSQAAQAEKLAGTEL